MELSPDLLLNFDQPLTVVRSTDPKNTFQSAPDGRHGGFGRENGENTPLSEPNRQNESGFIKRPISIKSPLDKMERLKYLRFVRKRKPNFFTGVGGFAFMKYPSLNMVLTTARRTIGYTVGSLLFALGILGFVVEVSEGKASSTIFAGYMLAAVFLICGIFLLLAIWSHYGGGLYSFIGATLVALVMIHVGFTVDMYLRGRYYLSPFRAILPFAVMWVIGCYCLVFGHMRHHRKKTIPPTTAPSPSATAP
jgi:hypothetical protein